MENLMKKVVLTLLIVCVGLMANNGAVLYEKNHCGKCHGIHGERKALDRSSIIKGTDVADKLKAYKNGTLNITGMGSLMRGQMQTLSDDDMDALAAYIKSL